MILFGAVLAAVPFFLPGVNPGSRTDPFWWAWWGVLFFWTLFWLVMFVRNPRFFMIILDGRLIWGDEMSRSLNGSVELMRVRELRVEIRQGADSSTEKYYVVLDDGSRRELPRNAMIAQADLLAEMQLVNPRIQMGKYQVKC